MKILFWIERIGRSRLKKRSSEIGGELVKGRYHLMPRSGGIIYITSGNTMGTRVAGLMAALPPSQAKY